MQNDLTALSPAELGQAIRESRRTGDRTLRAAIEVELDRRAAEERAQPVERPMAPARPQRLVRHITRAEQEAQAGTESQRALWNIGQENERRIQREYRRDRYRATGR